MKQRFIFLMAVVLLAIQGWAAPVDLSKAQAVAQNFARANGHFLASSGSGLKLAYAEQSGKVKNQPVFYVFNTSGSYVIVAGDDRAEDVLAYGDGMFDINDIPCGMRSMLNIYKEEIEFLQTHPKMTVEKYSQGTPSFMATSVSPLISTTWGQGSPYYNYCPKYKGNYCATGCVATAMAQIMQFWKYPSTAPAMSAYTTSKLGISVPALSSKTLSYTKSNDAIAWIMRYAGHAVSMDYAPASEGGSGAVPTAARNAFVNKFNFSSSAYFYNKSNCTNSTWNSKLKTELNAGHPVYYRAVDDNGNGGHAFIIDGYNASGLYHINWGWNGSNNGYFALNSFNTSGCKFNSDQRMIVDLRPKTTISCSPSSWTITNGTVNKTATKTFKITLTNYVGDPTVTLAGATNVFKITKKTVTKSGNKCIITVTVTYKPLVESTTTATLTISNGGLTASETISLKGTAKIRTITVSPTTLAFGNVTKGKTVSKTFKVTGKNLNGPLTVKLTDITGMFSINKTTITVAQATSGATVTVTFSPTAIGVQVAKVTISGGDAESIKTVNLKGTGVKSGGGVTPTPTALTGLDLEKVPITEEITNLVDQETTKDGGGSGYGGELMAPRHDNTDVKELSVNINIFAEDQSIIIESDTEHLALISDLAGHVQHVKLQAGRNEIPVNSSGMYIVRVGEKTAKLMLR